MIETITELLEDHLEGDRLKETLDCYTKYIHESWTNISPEGEVIGFITYFFMKGEYDMIITAAKGNRFSKSQWRILQRLLQNRTRKIVINSDPNNKVLHRGAAKLGGKFIGEDVYFPLLEEE